MTKPGQKKLEKDNARGMFNWWSCTWNNPPEDCFLTIVKAGADYTCGQLEHAPTTGTLHFQFVLYFAFGRKGTTLAKALPHSAHIGKRKDAAYNMLKYVDERARPKEGVVPGSFKEFGIRPVVLMPTEEQFVETLDHCKHGEWELSCASHQVRYMQNLTKLTAFYSPAHERPDVCGVWITGSSGTGKSYLARSKFPAPYYIKAQNKWFDNYRREETIILDDFDTLGTGLSHHLKIWTDRYRCQGEIKGGTVQLNHSHFVVTSQYTIAQLWKDDPEVVAALERRFRVFKVAGTYPDFILVPDQPSSYQAAVFALYRSP